ncbi:hypothetical protein [Streptomyces sp. NPDC097981]|uniref:hypothetical protein n=1 Tax=Streptomyces sp. NPDC097981 TaxID=3155428 RepID=UPI003327D6C8
MITRGEMPRVRRVCVLARGAAAVSWELPTHGRLGPGPASGAAFPLPASVLAERPADTPARPVAGVHAALLRHTGGQLADDGALLVLRSDRSGHRS